MCVCRQRERKREKERESGGKSDRIRNINRAGGLKNI